MGERYTRLSSLPENRYSTGAPVLIAAGALLKDNQSGKTLAQIKFKSISEKQIKAVKVSIAAFDVYGKELEGVAEYQYLDLAAERAAEFGHKQAVTLPNANTRSFEVKCAAVFFTDGTVWNAEPDAVWSSLPAQKTVTTQLGDLAAQYQRDTSFKSKYIPLEHEDLWLCSCGTVNHDREANCNNCRCDKTMLLKSLDVNTLRRRKAVHEKAEEEKAAEEKAQRIKSIKNTLIAAIIMTVVTSVFLLCTKIIIPYCKYTDAVALMKDGKYEEAIVVFKAVEGYKDTVDKIEACEKTVIDGEYKKAIALMNDGKYEEAIDLLEAIEGYLDTTNKIAECEISIIDRKYKEAIALLDAGRYDDAENVFEELRGYLNSADLASECQYRKVIGNIQEGDIYIFGAYEQDNDRANGREPIEWIVLEIEKTRILVISKYALDCRPFDDNDDENAWDSCDLRQWLNNTFLKTAFSDEEQKKIPKVTVEAQTVTYSNGYQTYTADPGENTEDYIFLLSVPETREYLQTSSERFCEATAYAEAQGAYVSNHNGHCWWWLRSPGWYSNSAAYIFDHGGIEYHFLDTLDNVAVRPVMWIELNS